MGSFAFGYLAGGRSRAWVAPSRSRAVIGTLAEFHYYTDRERWVAWQVPLLTPLQTRFPLVP